MKTNTATPISQTFNGRAEFAVPGGYFKLLTAAAATHVELWNAGVRVLDAPAVKGGFYLRVDFDRVVITNPSSQLTEFLAAPEEGGQDSIIGNINVLQGTAITNNAEATVGVAESNPIAANSSRKSIRFRAPATNVDNIYLGATGITTANGTLELKPGETWVESDGAGAAWYAISGTAAQKLRTQEIS